MNAKLASILLIVVACTGAARAQNTTFTYQGQLQSDGAAFSGPAEFRFTLWDAADGGTQLAATAPETNAGEVTEGLFLMSLDFGSAPFGAGQDRWLQIALRTGLGEFQVLTPRQHLSAVPYAITAVGISGELPGGGLAGIYPGVVNLSNPDNTYGGSGSGLTALNASELTGGTVPITRLGSGTANSTTFLRGDNTWAVPPGTGGNSFPLTEDVSAGGFNITNFGLLSGASTFTSAARGEGGLAKLTYPAGDGTVTNRYFSHITNAIPHTINLDGWTLTIAGEHEVQATAVTSDGQVLADGHGLFRNFTDGTLELRPGSRVFAKNYGNILIFQNFTNLTIKGPGTIDGTRAGVGEPNTIAAGIMFRRTNENVTIDGIRVVNMPNQGISHLFAGSGRNTRGQFIVRNSYFDNIGQTNFLYSNGDAPQPDGNVMSGLPWNAQVVNNFGRNLWRGFLEYDAFDITGLKIPSGIVANNDVETFRFFLDTRPDSLGTTTNVNLLVTGNLIKAMEVPVATSRPLFWIGDSHGITISGNQIHLGTNVTLGEYAVTFVPTHAAGVRRFSFTDNDVYGGRAAIFQGSAGHTYLRDFAITGNRFYDQFSSAVALFKADGGFISGNQFFDGGQLAATNAFVTLVQVDGAPLDNVQVSGNEYISRLSADRTGFLRVVREGGLGSYIPTNTIAFNNDGTLLAGDAYAHIRGGPFNVIIHETGTGLPVRQLDPTFTGKVGINTTTPSEQLHVIGNIMASGTITSSSARNLKTNFDGVDAEEVLKQVVSLPIHHWTYRAEDAAVRHLGPMAQDFHAAFGLGANDTTIATVDADGVALTAIQGLNQKLEKRLEQKDTEIAALQAQRVELLRRLEALEQRLH